jgi:UDP-N-acetylglucosamine transferase subunit ALG13
MDEWAGSQAETVVGQVGPSKLKFRHIDARAFMSSAEMDRLFASARLVVAHAGMGSILSALKHRKPIIIVPRKASLAEHRNEHQLATARWMQSRPGVSVAWEPAEVFRMLAVPSSALPDSAIADHASPEFIAALQRWLHP